MKPCTGKAIYVVPVPHSHLHIRMWDRGMAMHRQFCLDFLDIRNNEPVNLPAGFELWPSPANKPGAFIVAGPLRSLEYAFGVYPENMHAGAEKFVVPEGTQHYPQVAIAQPHLQIMQ